jgi:hypothetical protein
MSKFWWTVPVAAAVMSGLGFASIRVLYPPPRLACDGPNFEFGVVEPGVELTHTFLIRNNGGRPLRIYSVESTCSCTSAEVSRTFLKPGETAELTAILHVPENARRTSARIAVESNDPAASTQVMTVGADPSPPLDFSATSVDFGAVEFGHTSGREAELIVSCRDPADLEVGVSDWATPSPIRAEIVRDDERVRLRVRLEGDVPIGPLTGVVEVGLKSAKGKHRRLSVRGEVVGPFRVEPPVSSLGVIGRDTRMSARVSIVAVNGVHSPCLRVDGMSPSLAPFVTASLSDGPTGRPCLALSVSGRGWSSDTPSVRGVVRLRCEGDTNATVNVPVSFYLASGHEEKGAPDQH